MGSIKSAISSFGCCRDDPQVMVARVLRLDRCIVQTVDCQTSGVGFRSPRARMAGRLLEASGSLLPLLTSPPRLIDVQDVS